MQKNTKRELLAVLLVAVLALGVLLAGRWLAPAAQAGSKTVTVNVDHLNGEDASFTFRTDADYLRGALEQEGLVGGREDEFGLWVESIDGETADEAAQQWWGYTVNGETAPYGVEEQTVTDGDVYDFTLNVGW